jgi:four helix bundle protein
MLLSKGVPLKDFHNLQVWKKSHELVLTTYRVTVGFPKEEMYGLTSQIRRASASIPANIAEGCGRDSDAELGRFFQIAMGSASELEYHYILARDLAYLSSSDSAVLIASVREVKQMLASFLSKLRKSSTSKADS